MDSLKHTLVIARFREDLSWIHEVPDAFSVVIYNKGPLIADTRILDRAQVISRPNVGRESETYCHHLLTAPHPADGITVFAQGDPFGHSPDFLPLLRSRSDWADVQTLGCRWKSVLPPPQVQLCDPEDRIGSLRVRRETFSLCYWGSLHFFDWGAARTAVAYWRGSLADGRLPAHTNVASDFLNRCGFHDLASQAADHLLGRFSYGAIFAVHNSRFATIPAASIALLGRAATGHSVNGYVIERLWLHIFGEPFVMPIAHAQSATNDVSSPHDVYCLNSDTVLPSAMFQLPHRAGVQ